jgi:hypothetical protein
MNCPHLKCLKTGALAGLALFAALAAHPQATNLDVDLFDTEDSAYQWSRWWGSASQLYEFDYSVDRNNDANSGSLKATIDFDLASFGGDNQFAVVRGFPEGATMDGTQYTNLVFSIRWSGDSPTTGAGDFGNLEFGLRNADYSQTGLGSRVIAASEADQWIDIAAPIDPATAKLDTITGVWLKLWSGGDGGLTGQTIFWVDDVRLLADANVVETPPSLRLKEATPGLLLGASAPGNEYQRQNVRTQNTDVDGYPTAYGWLHNATPVTYSFTVRSYPDATHSGFQTHLFLVPELGMPYGPGDASIDWNAPHVVFVQLANNEDGTATARFMYKTNLPGGNAMLWNTDPANGPVGTLASITDASAIGKWSVTFNNNTEVTLATPSGLSTNFAMPAEATELFAEPLYAYFGIQPNGLQNVGASATLSRIQITGAPTPLDDSFSGETLDTTRWATVAADASGIVQVPPTSVYSLSWDAPATGFTPQASATIVNGSWNDNGLTNIIQIGSEKISFVPESSLPSAGTGFFRLSKP